MSSPLVPCLPKKIRHSELDEEVPDSCTINKVGDSSIPQIIFAGCMWMREDGGGDKRAYLRSMMTGWKVTLDSW